MKELCGYIERITFHSPDSGFTVAKLQEPKKEKLTCLVGTMPLLQPGETVKCQGHWKNDPNHGWQFAVESVVVEAPATLVGIQKYLESGMIKGIGPVYATRIVERFREHTLDVIDEEPERLLEVEGIGKGRLEKIKTHWAAQRAIREVMIFLQAHGVSPTYAQKIFKAYGDLSIQKVRDNPYQLARDIFGIGFKTADQIAQKLGIEKDSPKRVEAGIEFVLSNLSNQGHVCYPIEPFIQEAYRILEVEDTLVRDQVSSLEEQKRVVIERGLIWLKTLYLAEKGIQRELKRLQNHTSPLRAVDAKRALEWVQERLYLKLAGQQSHAVEQALSEKVQIITGGPGTGKSTITKAILTITQKLTTRILLAAPTGRAAKRMTEITKRDAKTIHSLLEYDFKIGGFRRGRETPLSCDLIIIDESSMIDTVLMYSLLKAIPSHARVIFVGDIDQLPSVGPGNVLRDMIASEKLPTTTLTHIFRQAAGSKIITNAHLINKGMFPSLKNEKEADFFFIEANETEEIQRTIIDLVQKRLPTQGFDPFQTIQVLAPMRRGIIGTEQLNLQLQQALNPSNTPLFRAGQRFHTGDKVMQIRNNYDKKVFNGDVGTIITIDEEDHKLTVNIDGNIIPYDFTELDELMLAYAVSVHKYQGSECPCIVMPIHTSHFKLLQRNLLYTAVTRGKKLFVLVGNLRAIGMAVNNNEVAKRHTSLREFLCA